MTVPTLRGPSQPDARPASARPDVGPGASRALAPSVPTAAGDAHSLWSPCHRRGRCSIMAPGLLFPRAVMKPGVCLGQAKGVTRRPGPVGGQAAGLGAAGPCRSRLWAPPRLAAWAVLSPGLSVGDPELASEGQEAGQRDENALHGFLPVRGGKGPCPLRS